MQLKVNSLEDVMAKDELDDRAEGVGQSVENSMLRVRDLLESHPGDPTAILSQINILAHEQCNILMGIYAELIEARHERRSKKN
jgi:hypothetical protein